MDAPSRQPSRTPAIISQLGEYLRAIEQSDDIDPFENGWVAIPCPQPETHTADPRENHPTFAVNLFSGTCRCSSCGAGGGIISLQRLLKRYVQDMRPPEVRKVEYSPHVPTTQTEVNIRAFPCESRHFYRDKDGAAYLAALKRPALEQNHPVGTVYVHRKGDKWQWGIGTRRELYRRELLERAPDLALTVIVGDEESADAVQGEFDALSADPQAPDGAATTWVGTDRGWRHTPEWREPLTDANIVFWPDNNNRSIKTMLAIADLVNTSAKAIWFLDVGRSFLPPGSTPAQAVEDGVSVFNLLKSYAMKVESDSRGERNEARMY